MRLIGLIQALHREGTTVVIATHDRALVQGLGYPEFRLAGGKLVPVPPVADAAIAHPDEV